MDKRNPIALEKGARTSLLKWGAGRRANQAMTPPGSIRLIGVPIQLTDRRRQESPSEALKIGRFQGLLATQRSVGTRLTPLAPNSRLMNHR